MVFKGFIIKRSPATLSTPESEELLVEDTILATSEYEALIKITLRNRDKITYDKNDILLFSWQKH